MRAIVLVALMVTATGSRVVTIAGHTSAAFQLLRSAGRCHDAGPLFLRASCGARELRLTQIPGCDGEDVQGCYFAGVIHHSHGDEEAAIGPLQQAATAGYRRPYADVLLAYHLQRRQESAEAAAVWRACGIGDCETWLVRAGTFETCEAAAALTKQGPRASFCLGALLRQAGRLEEALTWFRRALDGVQAPGAGSSAPPDEGAFSRADVLYRIGEVELARGQVAEARRLTSECLAADPQNYWGRFQWALLVSRAGDTKGAIDELEALIARYPAHGAAMLNVGLLYESIGNYQKAEYWFVEARKVLPDRSLADAQLQRIRMAGPPSRLP